MYIHSKILLSWLGFFIAKELWAEIKIYIVNHLPVVKIVRRRER